MSDLSDNYVEETRFGFWFLRSHTWQHHVLRVAINGLRGLFSETTPGKPVLLDAGCGQGKSFQYLRQPKPFGQREETLVNVVARKPVDGVE